MEVFSFVCVWVCVCVCMCVMYWIALFNEDTTLNSWSVVYQWNIILSVLIWALYLVPKLVPLSVQISRSSKPKEILCIKSPLHCVSNAINLLGVSFGWVVKFIHLSAQIILFMQSLMFLVWMSHPSSLLERHYVHNQLAGRWLCLWSPIFFLSFDSSELKTESQLY